MFAQTDIYAYEVPNIGDVVYADPSVVRRALMQATDSRCVEYAKRCQALDAILQKETNETPEGKARIAVAVGEQVQLQAHLAYAGFQAFKITPLDEETGLGHTEACSIQLVLDFCGWCEEKKEAAIG